MKNNDIKVNSLKISEMNKKVFENKNLFESIQEEEKDIIIILNKAFENNDIIYYFRHKDQIKAVYIIEKEEEQSLKLKYKFCSSELTNESSKLIEELIIDEFKEYISLGEYKKLVWEDKEIEQNTIQIGNYNISSGIIIFLLCILLGIIFKQIFVGVCIGICFAMSEGIVINSEKKSDKRKKYISIYYKRFKKKLKKFFKKYSQLLKNKKNLIIKKFKKK